MANLMDKFAILSPKPRLGFVSLKFLFFIKGGTLNERHQFIKKRTEVVGPDNSRNKVNRWPTLNIHKDSDWQLLQF